MRTTLTKKKQRNYIKYLKKIETKINIKKK